MTTIFLLISDLFKWSFGFFDFAANFVNWILFFAGTALFTNWCYVLYSKLGGNKDKAYHSPTEGHHPYYDPKIYKKES